MRFRATLLLALAACSGGPSRADRYLIYDRPGPGREYALTISELPTLEDARTGNGAVAEIRGGGNIAIPSSEPRTEADFENLLRIENDRAPAIDFEVDADGVAVPWDWDSLLMLSLYHHLERASDLFDALGVKRERVRKLPVYYSPQLTLPIIPVPLPLLTDNAAYAPTMDAFLIPPTFFLHEVPLVTNRGVLVHEYSHVVFNRLAGDDLRVAPYLLENWPDAARNELRSLDEGLADTFGAIETGDPNFIAPSISEELFGLDRDLSVKRIYTGALSGKISTRGLANYNPYELGSVIASTLWAVREQAGGDRALAQIIVEAIDGLPVDRDFRVTGFFDRVYERMPVENRAAVCRTFRERLAAVAAELHCAE